MALARSTTLSFTVALQKRMELFTKTTSKYFHTGDLEEDS